MPLRDHVLGQPVSVSLAAAEGSDGQHWVHFGELLGDLPLWEEEPAAPAQPGIPGTSEVPEACSRQSLGCVRVALSCSRTAERDHYPAHTQTGSWGAQGTPQGLQCLICKVHQLLADCFAASWALLHSERSVPCPRPVLRDQSPLHLLCIPFALS